MEHQEILFFGSRKLLSGAGSFKDGGGDKRGDGVLVSFAPPVVGVPMGAHGHMVAVSAPASGSLPVFCSVLAWMEREPPKKKQKGEVCPAEAFLHGALLQPTCGSEQPFPTTDEASAWTFSSRLELKLLLLLFLSYLHHLSVPFQATWHSVCLSSHAGF